jgi:polyisoprenoid-binding protein YceI
VARDLPEEGGSLLPRGSRSEGAVAHRRTRVADLRKPFRTRAALTLQSGQTLTRMRKPVRAMRPWIVLAGLLPFIGAQAARAHHLQPGNTQISFRIEHLGLQWFSAAFHELSGDLALAPDAQGGRLAVIVRTASLDSRSTYWDERLRSAQWLDTAKYPEMSYRSTRIVMEGPTRASVEGELTLHGVTRPLVLRMSDIDCPQTPPGTVRPCRFVGRATLKRSDFGLPHGFWEGGDQVQIVLRGD